MKDFSKKQKISRIEIGINLGNNKLHQGEYLKFKIKLSIKKNSRNPTLTKINNSVTTNIRKVYTLIHIESKSIILKN